MNKNDKKPHLYGIYGYFGLPGYGKTMAMSWELLELRKKYKDQIYIFTYTIKTKKYITAGS